MSERKVNTGRNLPLATAVGLALLAGLIASLAFNRWAFAVVAAVAGVLATREIRRMFEAKGIRLHGLASVAVPAVVVISYSEGLGSGLIALGIATIIGWGLELRQGVNGFVAASTAFAFTMFYIGASLAFVAELARAERGFGLVLTAVLLTVANDTGGYFAGILAGKHPMVPNISPKKSWEGFAGSLGFTAFIGATLVPMLIPISWWQGLAAGLLMACTATVGDLVESAFKRDTGIKDSGDVIPGHGGMLDRIDSLLVNVPVTWLLFVWVLNV